MGLFSKLFNKKAKTNESVVVQNKTQQFCDAEKFNVELNEFLSNNIYYSRRSYASFINNYKGLYEYFNALKDSGMLLHYCKNNNVPIEILETFLSQYQNIKGVIDTHNVSFIESSMRTEKVYLDNILKEIDPMILLDNDQRKAVLVDEDYCLIIAGAGAGKTTTVAAKVKYLVDKKGVDPKEILVISFTNKAVNELKERINKNLKIDCPITTFHSTGNAILRKQSDEKLNIKEESFLFSVVNDYLKKQLLNKTMINNLIMFFGSYFDAPYEGNNLNEFFNSIIKFDFSTLKSNLNDFSRTIINIREKKKITINNEILRSMQEVQIANFLYLNGIEYEYEAKYPYHIFLSKKPYTPDFSIKQDGKIMYLEHFGITEDGKHTFYKEDELVKYKKSINDKIEIHKKHETKLIYTYSGYVDGKELIEHLRELVLASGFELRPLDKEEVYGKLALTEENKYISKLIVLIVRFINNFKTNGYTEETFYTLLRKNPNVRTKLFLEIAKECYLQYQKRLLEENAVDFQDMINEAARALREYGSMNKKLDFKYIIVDEYQDISKQRFDLTKELSNVTNAKIVAVGDDWQSVYAFSGSDISLFTKFCEKMGYGEELKIVNTYRNAQEVIDIAGNFVQKNTAQIAKTLKSPKHIEDPVLIYSYDDTVKKFDSNGKYIGGALNLMCQAIETAIGKIVEQDKQKNNKKVLLIGRYGFDGKNLEKSNLFDYREYGNKIICKKYPQIDMQFLTAHSSKGLGYDDVIIINVANGIYGFPCKIDDDPVLKLVTFEDKSIEYAEERRLFYVAMTRTKNRVYMIVPQSKPSEFALELMKDYKNIKVSGEISPSEQKLIADKICPICGYPLKYKLNNNYGLKLYMCTNEPEVCNFISNDLHGGKMSIQKCMECQDGYLIAKQTKDGEAILGCTNYKADKTGCNNLMTFEQYEKTYSIAQDILEIEIKEDNNTSEIELREVEEVESVDGKDCKSVLEDFPKSNTYDVRPMIKVKEELRDPMSTEKQPTPLENHANTNINDENQDCEEERYAGDGGMTGLALELRNYAKVKGAEENIQFWKVLRKKAILGICEVKPTSIEELANAYGIGAKKIEKYGKDIISIVKNFAIEAVTPAVANIAQIYTTIKCGNYNYIVDENGEIITDSGLFEQLRRKRADLAKEVDLPAYCIISNDALVGLATFKPKTKEEWIAIKGLRDRTYEKYGEIFMEIIRKTH